MKIIYYPKVDVKFSDMTVEWDNTIMSFKDAEANIAELYYIPNDPTLQDESEQLRKILDAKYKAADPAYMASEQTQLDENEQRLLAKHNLQ